MSNSTHHSGCIIAVTHGPEVPYESDAVQPICVSSACRHQSGWLQDNTDTHISEKNPNYCELTALYWLWKNKPDLEYYGLFHYRRFLALNASWLQRVSRSNKTLKIDQTNQLSTLVGATDQRVRTLLAHYDLLLPKPNRLKGSIKSQYSANHHAEDWHLLEQTLYEKFPEQSEAIHFAIHRNQIFYTNMMIAKPKVFHQYCNWLFDVLSELEVKIEISNDPYQARVFGFLSERLQNIWLAVWGRELKVKHFPIAMWTGQ